MFFASTAFVFLNFSLPVRADDLGIDAVGIGGMYAVFTGSMLLIRPLVGICLDRFGRRWFFVSAFAFYAASMSVFARSTDITDFYVARALQGVGASLMWVSARTIIGDLHDATQRGAAMGRLTATSVRGSMIGATYGFTLLGFLPMQQAWSLAFAGYAALALIGLAWAWRRVPETRVQHRQEQRPRLQWTPPLRRVMVLVLLSTFASSLIEPIYLIYLKHKFDAGSLMLAMAFLPAGLVFAIVPGHAGRWADRLGRAPIIATGVAFAGIVAILLPFAPSLLIVAATYILFAVGWAMASPAEDALVADLAPEALRGTVLGTREAAAGIGAALGPLLGGVIYEQVSPEAAFLTNGVLLLSTGALTLGWFARR